MAEQWQTPPAETSRPAFCERHFRALAVLTLGLAAFNLTFRLDREFITTWDESLYATTAAEMLASGDWVVTTFGGTPDYYNAKPPLNVWLIAGAFKVLGIGFVALRLPSAIAAWLTIFLVQRWTRRTLGATAAILSTLVLSTMFAFLYLHAGRSGNADAPFTLAVTATAIVLWDVADRPWRAAWLGPLVAAAFLLKGMAALMPVALGAVVLATQRPGRRIVTPLLASAVLFAAPTTAWAWARWRADGTRFFEVLVGYDFLARTAEPLDGHSGAWWYYLHVLQKDHYDWLAVAVILGIVLRLAKPATEPAAPPPASARLRVHLLAWAAVTFFIPSVMATKLAWYLNPFYPVCAVLIAMVLATAAGRFAAPSQRRERRLVAAMIAAALLVAESKLLWYSYQRRTLDGTLQATILASRDALRGGRVAHDGWDFADRFVLEHMAGGIAVEWPDDPAAGSHDFTIVHVAPRRWAVATASVP